MYTGRVGCHRSAGTALLFRPLAFAQLRECRREVSPVAIRAHPARRTLDSTQLAGAQEQELMRLARASLHANPVPSGIDRANASDAAIRDAHTITDREASRHPPTSNLLRVAIPG